MQKHLDTGHTWIDVDSVHAAIERRLRDRQIFWPAEYTQVIISARQHPKLYTVRTADRTFFRGFSKIQQYKSMWPGTVAGDPQVVDLEGPFAIPMADSFRTSLCILKSAPQTGRAQQWSMAITKLYKHSLPIKNKSKWQHLQELKKSPTN